MPAKIRNALARYRPMAEASGIEIWLHQDVLYTSTYRADDELLVNQHAYGVPAAHSRVFSLKRAEVGALADAYLGSFERVREGAMPLLRRLGSAPRRFAELSLTGSRRRHSALPRPGCTRAGRAALGAGPPRCAGQHCYRETRAASSTVGRPPSRPSAAASSRR